MMDFQKYHKIRCEKIRLCPCESTGDARLKDVTSFSALLCKYSSEPLIL